MGSIEIKRQSLGGEWLGMVQLKNPDKLNALDAVMLDELESAIQEFGHDPEIRVIAVRGTGDKAFSAGADVGHFAELKPMDAVQWMERGQNVFRSLERSPKPVIAAINGYALGGGMELALACDFRIAASQVRMGQPEITLANLPGWGGTQRLPRLIGIGLATDLILSGRLIDASEALSIHLVHRVVPLDQLEGEVLDLAKTLASHDAGALAMAKAALLAARGDLEAGLLVERQGVGLCWGTSAQTTALQRLIHRKG